MHNKHTARPRMRLAARIAALLHVLVFFALATLFAAVLTGCTTMPAGIAATDDERTACEAESCTVWTERELESLARKFSKQGYSAGVKSL